MKIIATVALLVITATSASAGCVSIPNTNASSCSYTAPEGEADEVQPSTAPVAAPTSPQAPDVVGEAPESDADKLGRLSDRRDSINDKIGRLKDRRSNHAKGSDKRKSINSKIRGAKDRRGNVNDRIDRTQDRIDMNRDAPSN